jgi:DNA-binding PucR family transcriptional regulator
MSGGVARQTMAVYLKCQLNVAKTAAVLKVNRKTIEGRLREIENVLARPLSSCFAELGVALRLEKKL